MFQRGNRQAHLAYSSIRIGKPCASETEKHELWENSDGGILAYNEKLCHCLIESICSGVTMENSRVCYVGGLGVHVLPD